MERQGVMLSQCWRTQTARGEMPKGLLAGFLGGLVACWAMNRWLALWGRVMEEDTAAEPTVGRRGRPVFGQGGQLAREGPDERQPPTMVAATALTRLPPAHTGRTQRNLGQVLHYTMGTATGALYGALAEEVPALTTAVGLPFGVAVWLLADELAVPALGLSKPPAHQDLAVHTYAFASHCVYGLTTELTRRLVRRYL